MAEQEKKPISVSELDIALIKRTLDENILKSMRNLFLGLKVSKAEKETIKATFKNDDLKVLLRKRFVPALNPDTPIGQEMDVWDGVEKMVFGFSQETIYQAVHYKQKAIDMAEMCLALLENPDGPVPDLEYNAMKYPADEWAVNLCARNIFIALVKSQIFTLYLTLLYKDPTPEGKTLKAKKDSTQ